MLVEAFHELTPPLATIRQPLYITVTFEPIMSTFKSQLRFSLKEKGNKENKGNIVHKNGRLAAFTWIADMNL